MGFAPSITTQHQQDEAVETRNADAWKRQVDAFSKSVLHEAYLRLPIRQNTIEASKHYAPANPDSRNLLPGSHKHLGGAYDPVDGCIYGVPANAQAVLCLYPEEGAYKMTCIPLPETVRDYKMKWLRGIFAHGYLWAIPAWAPAVLCVDVDAYWKRRPVNGDIVQLIDLPEEHHKGMIWQWHGAGINQAKTAIYCIPSNAQSVLKVDLLTKTTSLIPIDYDEMKYPDFRLDLVNKWYGGILGNDNAVYGIPYRACAVLRIDCNTDRAELIGPDYGIAKYNWHGGIQVRGKIYAHPSHAPDTVLVIDTNKQVSDASMITELPIHRASYDTDTRQNYKWLGGAVGRDGNIYCPACDTSAVLKIDTSTDTCTTFGFAGKDKNKWQGGILAPDGCVYCIPASGNAVLRISTVPDNVGNHAVQLLGPMPPHKDKWQGGYVGKDGCLYFIPENGYRVMKVIPPQEPVVVVDGEFPKDDVRIEMM
jgi:hypothetical protein